jgi:hypothetical protein
MPKVLTKQNNDIQALLTSVKIALEKKEFDEVISALQKILAIKQKNKVTGSELADLNFDLAFANFKAAKSSKRYKVKSYLTAGIFFAKSAIEHYADSEEHADDRNECHALLSDLSERFKKFDKRKDSVRRVVKRSHLSKIHYRKLLIEGSLVTSSKIEDEILYLTLHGNWNNEENYRGIYKMFMEIQRNRPVFRSRLQVIGWDQDHENYRFQILDKEKVSSESYLTFIQEQAITSRATRYLDLVANGNIIVKVIKDAYCVTLELAPNFTAEEIYNINVALYNKYIKSKEFQSYFGRPCKNQKHPTMAMKEPAKGMSDNDIKSLICRLCSKDHQSKPKKVKAKKQVATDNSSSSKTLSTVSQGEDSTDFENPFERQNPSYLPSFEAFNDSIENQCHLRQLIPFPLPDVTENEIDDWAKYTR